MSDLGICGDPQSEPASDGRHQMIRAFALGVLAAGLFLAGAMCDRCSTRPDPPTDCPQIRRTIAATRTLARPGIVACGPSWRVEQLDR
jgi:hypothetical protein